MSVNNLGMNIYKRHRFPPQIISYAVWLYHRFSLSHRDVEDLLAERGITVSRESIRLWCNKFGPEIAQRLRRKHPGFGDTLARPIPLQDRHRQIGELRGCPSDFGV